MRISFLIACSMFKAWIVGVPKALSNPPCLWLNCPADLPADPEEALFGIAGYLDRIFQTAPFRYRFFYARKCLLRSLVVVWFARKMNAEVIVHFGMKRMSKDIQGHCWLTFCSGGKSATETDNGYQEIWHYRVAREAAS